MEKNNFKIIFCVIAIVAILIVMIFVVSTKITNKTKIFSDSLDTTNEYNFFVVYSSDNAGVIDRNGNKIIDTIYNDVYIPNPSKDVFFCYTEDENFIVLNRNNELIFNGYDVSLIDINSETYEFENKMLKYRKNNLYGLIDYDGNILTEAIYTEISSLYNRPGVVMVKNGDQYGILNSLGNEIVPVQYYGVSADNYFSDNNLYQKTGYIISNKTSTGINYGYIDYNGNLIVESKYESIERVKSEVDSNIYLIAMQNGKKGVLKNEKKIIDFNFQDIEFKSNIFIVNKNGKYGFYNTNGKLILKPSYSEYSIAGDYISVKNEDIIELYDTNGNLINSSGYTKMISTENPSYFITQNSSGYYSIISKDINIEKEFISVSYAFGEYFIFTNSDKNYGVIDASIDDIVVEPKYDYIFLVDGMSCLEAIDNQNGITDIYSEKIEKTISMKNGVVNKIDENYATVYSDEDIQYINKIGEVVQNKDVFPNKKMYATKNNGKWGFCDIDGNCVVDYIYDAVTDLNEYGYASVEIENKWGVIDENGNIIVEPSYEISSYYFPQFIGKYHLVESESIYCEEL